ncbi:MAG: glycosyltransferase family 4 protein [Candidatus Geothermarchaeales archaeon]
MKVGMLHYTAPKGVIAGVEIVMDYHARFLTEEEYEVHMIFGRGGGLEYRGVVEHEIPLLSATHPRVKEAQGDALRGKSTPKFEALKEEIKKDLLNPLSEVDVCIVHNIPSMPFNFAATAAINEIATENKAKMIYWVHDSALLRDEWKDRMGKFPLTLMHHKAPSIRYVTVTKARAQQLANLPEPYAIRDIQVIPNGISVEEYLKIDETTKDLMKKLGLTFEDFIIVTPVRVLPRKNIDLAFMVVDRLKHLMGAKPPIKLVITGPPEEQTDVDIKYLEYLKGMIEKLALRENVIFCHEIITRRRKYEKGRIVKWSVADAFNIADLVFVPSKEEGFGLPIIEAGAARKPVFCSRIPPFQELIRDDVEGYMFNLDDDPMHIAFRIHRLIMDDRVGNNFNNVMERFSWETIIKKMLIPLL